MKDHSGSLPAFAGGDVASERLNLYPPHYKAAFAFSTLLYPQLFLACLATRLPLTGRATGLPCSVRLTMNGLGSLFPPVVSVVHDEGNFRPRAHHVACLTQACQHLWLVLQ